ncbi:MAG: biotin-dependent carboxyltransferase family protein [Vicinamibacterales bacterium]
MSAASLTIQRPGLLTTVQDLGRWGHQALGVPVAGAMDTRSLRQANLLVGNDDGAAALEITLLGPTLRTSHALTAAVAGANLELRVDGRRVPVGRVFTVPAGGELQIGGGAPGSGARAYLAVAGGIDIAAVLGSRSTHLVSRMGGLAGRSLVAGDVLPIGASRRDAPRGDVVVPPAVAPAGGRLRVLLGPQDDWFATPTLDTFLASTFTVSPRSDRMGFRLEGPPIAVARQAELVSEPVAFGAIQVPSGGAPILLMADRQTAGGYPKIATVIAADLPLAGLRAPGSPVCFAAGTRADARAALIAREREIVRLLPEVAAR